MHKILCPLILLFSVPAFAAPYPLEVLPAEHKHSTDETTGAKLTYLTTHPADDTNLYFHERSWTADNSLILFNSNREKGGLMAYLVETGELIHLRTPDGGKLHRATAASHHPSSVYALHNRDVYRVDIQLDTTVQPTKVTAHAHKLCTLPDLEGPCSLNENSDGTFLSIGATRIVHMDGPGILKIDTKSGEVHDVLSIPKDIEYHHHVQWSRSTPHLMSFASAPPNRLQVIDTRTGKLWSPYTQREGELATHECWWDQDKIIFYGGTHPEPHLDSHCKVIDVHTEEVRIIGAGAWWPGATPEELTKENWWHGNGSDDGRWVVGDNWHGDIALFEARTTRKRLLTLDHRTYGGGQHPHVSFDRQGKQVIFASHKLGDVNVCIATIPEAWQQAID